MIDVRFTPKVNGKKEKAYLLLFALIAVVAFIFSLTPIQGKGILQFVFVLFVALDMMIGIKYFLSSYTYTLTDEYGDCTLIVTQTQGKRVSTFANFLVKDIREISLKPYEAALADVTRKYGASAARYNYVVGMKSEENILALTVRSDYVSYVVFLSDNKEFHESLLSIWNSTEREDDEF